MLRRQADVLERTGEADLVHQTEQERHQRRRLPSQRLPGVQRQSDFGLADDLALVGGFVAGPEALRRFAGDAPLDTDDRPVVAYRAPRVTCAPETSPGNRLSTALSLLPIRPADLLNGRTDARWSRRLAAHWPAARALLQASVDVQPDRVEAKAALRELVTRRTGRTIRDEHLSRRRHERRSHSASSATRDHLP